MKRRLAVTLAALTPLVLAQACGGVGLPAEEDSSGPVVIGLSTVASGTTAGMGNAMVQGAELAINAANDAGGIDGRQLELRWEDNGCNPTDGVSAISKIVGADPKPIAVLGAFCSNATLASMPIVERNKVPLLVDIASAPAITEGAGVGGNEWVFRWGGNDDVFAQVMIDYLKDETDIRRISVVVDNTDYGQGGLASVKKALETTDEITVVSEDVLDMKTSDFTPTLTRIERAKPDAIFIWAIGVPGTLTFLSQYGDSNLKDLPLVGKPNSDPPTLELVKEKKLNGLAVLDYDPAAETSENEEFLAAWDEAYGNTDGAVYGYYGYQGAQVAIAAARDAESLDAASVRDALETLDYGPSVLGGQLSFDDHNQARNKMVLVEISEAGSQVLELLTPADESDE